MFLCAGFPGYVLKPFYIRQLPKSFPAGLGCSGLATVDLGVKYFFSPRRHISDDLVYELVVTRMCNVSC
jgi:hypothetical protein